jgi:hypothetical protein
VFNYQLPMNQSERGSKMRIEKQASTKRMWVGSDSMGADGVEAGKLYVESIVSGGGEDVEKVGWSAESCNRLHERRDRIEVSERKWAHAGYSLTKEAEALAGR